MSVYCIVLLQFAFLHIYSLKTVNAPEVLQNLAKLRGIYQIMKEKFYAKNTIHLPLHGINQWLKILYFQAFDGIKK